MSHYDESASRRALIRAYMLIAWLFFVAPVFAVLWIGGWFGSDVARFGWTAWAVILGIVL